MKNKLLKIGITEIISSFKRFISLFIMSMLGVGVFVGLSATAPDMTKSLDTYYDKMNLYDMRFLSTLGFSDNTLKEFENIDTVSKVVGTHSKDVMTKLNEEEFVVRFIEIPEDINKIEVKEGHLPKTKNEILVEEALLSKNNLKIGDTIVLDDENFNSQTLKIVGTVKSSLYIGAVTPASSRGNTTIGTGKVDYYAYTLKDNFNMDYYTDLYITVKGAKKETTDSTEYLDLINSAKKEILKKKSFIENSRYKEIYNDALSKIKKEEKESGEKLDQAKEELDSAKVQLTNGYNELDKSNKLLSNAKNELDKNKELLDSTNKELIAREKQLQEKKQLLDSARNQIDAGKERVNNTLNPIGVEYEDVRDLKERLDRIKDSIPTEDEVISYVPTTLTRYDDVVLAIHELYELHISDRLKDIITDPDTIDEVIDLIPDNIEYHDEIIEGLNVYKEYSDTVVTYAEEVNSLVEAEQQYEEGLRLYQEGYQKYIDGKNKYSEGYKKYLSGLKEYEEGYSKYQEGLNTYYSNYNIYNTSLEEYYNSRKLFENGIKEAYKKLDSIEKCELYTYTRLDDKDYSGYMEDGKSIENLSKLFPTIFFIVAVLISLISMSRMVEDDRIEIGTLKSLGFGNKHIRMKYLIYSATATFLGGLVGSILGFFLLTKYIFGLYKMLFVIDKFVIDYDFTYIILGIGISLLCICGTTIITINKVVREKPSELMRPKAPKNGKNVFLEKIPFIWKRLNFSKKITIRNLIRYKKRIIMTTIGILGCTALTLTGFGIRDSIIEIPSMQFDNILTFSDTVYVLQQDNESDIDKLLEKDEIKNYTKTKMTVGNVKTYNTNLFVPEDESDLINTLQLRDVNTKESLELKDNTIYVSDKLADLVNKKEGDIIKFSESSGKTYSFKITKVFENYAGNYIVMNKNTYEKIVGEYHTNLIYVNLKKSANEEKIQNEFMKDSKIMSVVSSKTMIDNVESMLKTLDSVVFVLIFLSGALSLVVLYNLAIINISERKRELATLKVLGFTDREVDNYINKETIIITVIGVILGLIFGVFLTNIIVTTIEVDMVRFIHKINLISYLITIIIMFAFTFIVNFVIHFTLKKIDMIESLKSVE